MIFFSLLVSVQTLFFFLFLFSKQQLFGENSPISNLFSRFHSPSFSISSNVYFLWSPPYHLIFFLIMKIFFKWNQPPSSTIIQRVSNSTETRLIIGNRTKWKTLILWVYFYSIFESLFRKRHMACKKDRAGQDGKSFEGTCHKIR